MKNIVLTSMILFFSFSIYGQDYFIVNDGVKTKDYQYNVFINANIHSSKGLISNGTLIERDGKIIDIGINLSIPNNSIVFDLDGVLVDSKTIHFDALNDALRALNPNYVITKDEQENIYEGLPTKAKLNLLNNF